MTSDEGGCAQGFFHLYQSSPPPSSVMKVSSILRTILSVARGFNSQSSDFQNCIPVEKLFMYSPSSLIYMYNVCVHFVTQMNRILEEYLDDYNQVNTAQMRLVLFLDAVRHVCRISRIIRQPLGNALLLGVGGSGRQSLTRLAAHM